MIRRRSRILRGGKAISAYLRKGVAAEPLLTRPTRVIDREADRLR